MVVVVDAGVLGHRVRVDVEQDGVPEQKRRRRRRRRERRCRRCSPDDHRFCFFSRFDFDFGGRDAVSVALAPPPLPLVRRRRQEEAGGLVRVEHAELSRATPARRRGRPSAQTPRRRRRLGALAFAFARASLPSFVYAQVVKT